MVRLLLLLLVLVLASLVQAWVPPHSRIQSCSIQPRTKFLVVRSTESDEAETEREASFDDAGKRILEQENEELAASLSRDEDDDEFEQRSKEYDAIREAIRARTAEMGIEKSVVTAKLIEEANARAVAERASGLDLSQVTGSFQTLTDDEDSMSLPTFADDLEEEFKKLPEEERKKIDPTDGMNWIDQSKEELKYIEWPSAMAALKEVALVVLFVAFIAAVIINFDSFLRGKFTELGMIPRPDEVTRQFEGLALPDGWTEGLTDQDVVNVPLE